jgi:glycosyltransferase involved in cell wall biosynthesis
MRLVIVVRADPAICGHSGEARNLAEAAIARGVDEVIIVTWPIDVLAAAGIPLKPIDSVLPYSPGITVERPEPVGDYKVPDGRFVDGIRGRLVELFTDGVPTVCLSLYLSPHATVVAEALAAARAVGGGDTVTTVAEAVGSDITNVVRRCVAERRFGPAVYLLSTYLAHDRCVAVSAYTKDLIVDSATALDQAMERSGGQTPMGRSFAEACRERIRVSYPAIDASAFTQIDPAALDAALKRRNLEPGGYLLFLSRVTPAKGVDDLLAAYARCRARDRVELVVAGSGPGLAAAREQVQASGEQRVRFLTDVDDAEKAALMAGCAAYVLPSKPRPEFVETFGIALVEKMLAGGGPVITTDTGGIPEAVGDTAIQVEADNPVSLAAGIDRAVLEMSNLELLEAADRARRFALRFDRIAIFDRLFAGLVDAADPDSIQPVA